MGRRITNVLGQRFGRLVVLARHSENSRWGLVRWLCRCDCGTEKVITGTSLVRKTLPTRSCGCWRNENVSKARRSAGQDLTGFRVGTRVVLGKGPDILQPSKAWGMTGWRCFCERCGRVWMDLPGHILRGWKKHKCRCFQMKPSEILVYATLQAHYPSAQSGAKRILTGKLELDVFIPELLCAIEIDGGVHGLAENRLRDSRKDKACAAAGIRLHRIEARRLLRRPKEELLKALLFCANK